MLVPPLCPPPHQLTNDSWVVCISNCGNHFLTCNAWWNSTNTHSTHIVVVRNFTEISAGDTVSLARHAIQIDMETQMVEFSFDGYQRVVVTKASTWTIERIL